MEIKTTKERVTQAGVACVSVLALGISAAGFSYLGGNGTGSFCKKVLSGFGYFLGALTGLSAFLATPQVANAVCEKYSFTEEDLENDVLEMTKEELDEYYRKTRKK